ncbi:MAG: helix-turn-helix transcriptional regulator [Bacteroidetes bacterium]|nr:helix-turn-helix transcriptional regulator [Bacteroidota bacterium]
MIDEMKQIAKRIKEIREISDISAEKMAENLGVTFDQYKQVYESGKC